MIRISLLLFLTALLSAADDMPWLNGCGWIDARATAAGDGATAADNTAALNALTVGLSHGGATVYLRDGTYVLSDTWQLGSKRMVLQGQSRARTVIRLRDNAPGFGDAKKPKPVLEWISYTANGLPSNFPKNRGMGQAFCNGLYDITVDVGSGNPGAIACYFITNNQGGMRNVTLRAGSGSGSVGLALDYAWPGPGLVSNLAVEGFAQGIHAGQNQYSMTFDRISLRGQREAGLVNDGQLLRISRLDSDNAVPAVLNRSFSSSLVLVDSRLRGSGAVAIDNQGTGPNKYAAKPDTWLPGAFLRAVEVQGYAAAVRSRWAKGDETVPAGLVAEWSSHPGVRLFGAGAVRSLPLALAEPDLPPVDPPSGWVSILAHGAVLAPAGSKDIPDATVAIQAAIDSGAKTVWIPRGLWQVSDSIHIRGAVSRIFGADGALRPKGFTDGKPLFIIEAGQPVVLIDRLHDSYGDCRTWFEHTVPSTLVLRHGLMNGYRNTVPGGKLFIEDVCGANWDLRGQQVVARQWNVESKAPGFNIRVRGGSIAILGYKTEYGQTVLDADDGAKIEVLGAYHYHGSQVPAYRIGQAQVSLVGIVAQEGYRPLVEQTRGGETRTLDWPSYHTVTNKVESVPGLVRVYGQHIPLFVSE